jgi:hypothetical protein
MPSETNVWYKLPDFMSGDEWFFCTEIQKNGGMAGVKVNWPWGKTARRPQPKATKHNSGALFEQDKSHYKKVPASEVPDEVREAAKAKGATGA